MKNLILIALGGIVFNLSNAQLSMNSTGGVTIGATPNTGYPWLDIKGNRGMPTQRNFRVTFPLGLAYANTELAGLAQIGSPEWVVTALYAKIGAASYSGYFEGTCYINGTLFYSSDSKLKENIRTIDSPLNKLLKIQGVQYDFKSDTIANSAEVRDFKTKISKDNLGFIAQDVLKILPEVVILDPASQYYAINYNGFIPLLVESIKEQQIQIESLRSEIMFLKTRIDDKSSLKRESILTNSSEIVLDKYNSLFQNSPNPFSDNTRIEYYLSEATQNAMICIYDMNGKQLKCFKLNNKGFGNVIINGSELIAGMYFYALIADGSVVENKKMVLTD